MGTLKTRCVIIGGGDCFDDILKENIKVGSDYIICADSGYDYAVSAGITPDLLIGDFDSIRSIPKDIRKVTLPVEKDVTDSVAAFNEGVNQKFSSFVLFGGTGGRFEHTFANVSLMAKASKDNIELVIIDEKHIFRAITNSTVEIAKKDNQQISVFAFGEKAFGVTEIGFHYPLTDYTLDPFDGCLGTSNDIVDDHGKITVENGTLVIIETKL